ncbi:hypothetical protein [Deinococcus aquaedulcis]|uniref:hypothetical protein n=1 Tax=Deinococcus aquaedulcis TaxID=2840455 RepID=UPI001C82F8D3|nr:hypothetical protein [Deinococcus aquaedulcis]
MTHEHDQANMEQIAWLRAALEQAGAVPPEAGAGAPVSPSTPAPTPPATDVASDPVA